MKKVLFLSASPRKNGNGDALLHAAMEQAERNGAEVCLMHLREKSIGFCKACYGCAKTGVCVQKDDFAEILSQIHEADAIIAAAPVYYNCMAAQMLTAVNRLCCTFACKTYVLGPRKKVGVMLTCTGSAVEEMKRHIHSITGLPSVSRAISEEIVEVFTGCVEDTTCADTQVYLARARKLGEWAAG